MCVRVVNDEDEATAARSCNYYLHVTNTSYDGGGGGRLFFVCAQFIVIKNVLKIQINPIKNNFAISAPFWKIQINRHFVTQHFPRVLKPHLLKPLSQINEEEEEVSEPRTFNVSPQPQSDLSNAVQGGGGGKLRWTRNIGKKVQERRKRGGGGCDARTRLLQNAGKKTYKKPLLWRVWLRITQQIQQHKQVYKHIEEYKQWQQQIWGSLKQQQQQRRRRRRRNAYNVCASNVRVCYHLPPPLFQPPQVHISHVQVDFFPDKNNKS